MLVKYTKEMLKNDMGHGKCTYASANSEIYEENWKDNNKN